MIRERVEKFFSPQGPLSRDAKFEYRRQQQEMALGISDALERGEHLIVEAGTGVGKSLAYLVPSILYSLNYNKQAVISTHTINLQEQLIHKDIPLLKKVIPEEFSAVVIKGRANYLCPRRLVRAMKHTGELFETSQQAELERIAQWAAETKDGSLSDFDLEPDPKVWAEVCSERGICNSKDCGQDCFYQRARRQMLKANVLIVNHHLFFTLASTGGEEEDEDGFLSGNDFVILDEAHTVEGVASDHVGLGISWLGVRYQLNRLYNPRTQKGRLTLVQDGEGVRLVSDLLEKVDLFFRSVESSVKFGNKNQVRIRKPDFVNDSISLPTKNLIIHLSKKAKEIEDKEFRAEMQASIERLKDYQASWAMFISQSDPGSVYWVSRSGKTQSNIELNSSPIDMAATLRRMLFERNSSCVMTSATLAIAGSLNYFKGRVGGEGVEGKQVGSPFDYQTQMKVYVPRWMPDPKDAEFPNALNKWIQHFIKMTHGKALVLFTSYQLMNELSEKLADFLFTMGIECLVQGKGMPRHKLLQKFKADVNSVLLGTESFWTGVDVPGEALSNVIITRLPFQVPDSPVIEARLEFIAQKGGDPFRDYSLPEAVLKFRQGVGRLIRTMKDKGIVVILDNRILNKSYGKAFMDSLPKCPVEIVG